MYGTKWIHAKYYEYMLLVNAIPLFVTHFRYRHRFWCRGKSMKQFRLGYFKTYLLLKKTCGDIGVIGITKLLDFFARVLRYGKKIRVQLCCENVLLRRLPSNTLTIFFCLEFHDPFLLCSDGFTRINLKLSCCGHFIFLLLYGAFSHHFPHLWSIYLFQTSISLTLWLSDSLWLDSVSSYSKSSSACN